MTAPTPGPWATEGSVIWAPEAAAVIAQASELRTNETVRFTPPSISSPDLKEIWANARLMAAAPDLLAALEEMTPDYEHCAPNTDGDIEPHRIALIERARAAIAAAKGEAWARKSR